MEKLQAVLKACFCMIDLVKKSNYLGIAIDTNLDKAEITLGQTVHLKKILQSRNMQNSRLIFTFMKPKVRNLLFLTEEPN